MKIYLIILLLISSLVIQAQNVIYNELDFKYTNYISYVCETLEISNKTIKVTNTDLRVQAHVIKLDNNTYIIFINTLYTRNILEVLAHEIVHIWQDIEGIWDITKPTTSLSGEYFKHISKEAKQIELQADLYSQRLVRRYNKIK